MKKEYKEILTKHLKVLQRTATNQKNGEDLKNTTEAIILVISTLENGVNKCFANSTVEELKETFKKVLNQKVDDNG